MAKYFAVSVRKLQLFNDYFSDTDRQMECIPSLVPVFSIQPQSHCATLAGWL